MWSHEIQVSNDTQCMEDAQDVGDTEVASAKLVGEYKQVANDQQVSTVIPNWTDEENWKTKVEKRFLCERISWFKVLCSFITLRNIFAEKGALN